MTMRTRMLVGVVAAALIAIGAPIRAEAQILPDQLLQESELADLRGGYLSAGGIVFDFGAVVRTYVDGRMALESRLTWTEAGALTSHAAGLDEAGARYQLADGASLGDLNLSGLNGAQGLLLTGSDGATALFHNIESGGLQNLIVNSADGRDFRQEIEIDLALPQLDAIQGAAGMDRLGAYINQDLNAAIIRSLGGN
jgi:hypothetical protein